MLALMRMLILNFMKIRVKLPASYLLRPLLAASALIFHPTPEAKAQSSITFGKTDWTLQVLGKDAVFLKELRQNSYIPWCFDFLKGRGILKQISLSLHWIDDARPQLALAKTMIQPLREDRDIISCLDASLKAFPPRRELIEDQLEFKFIRNRR